MKRFYCTVCRAMRRQAQWPRGIKSKDSPKPEHRRGVCKFHTRGQRTGVGR